MTVDVEDYFHVSAFEQAIAKDDWDSLTPRVDHNTHRLLDIFAEHNVKATFFVLGWVAQRCPALIQRIAAEGHELGSHGTNHARLTTLTQQQAYEDIAQSKDRIEQISGKAVMGYRAPSFSINAKTEYVYDILARLGFMYSSSTYPIEHDLYGVPHWPRFPYRHPSGIVEIPIPTLRQNQTNIGIGGGGYFRLFPYWFSKRRINEFLTQEQKPYSFYFHPWEIDPEQPRVKDAPLKSKLRHYVNLNGMEDKLNKLLLDFTWSSMAMAYADELSELAPKVPMDLSRTA